MSNRRRLLIAGTAAVLSALLLGIFLHGSATAAERSQQKLLARYGGETAEVLVARRSLPSGTMLSVSQFEARTWPVSLIPDGALLKKDRAAILGKRTYAYCARGEILVRERIVSQPTRLDALKEGFTAVTLSTDAVHALGGEIRSGMRVTLMNTKVGGTVTPLATNIEVLSSSSNVQEDAEESSQNPLLGAGAADQINWVTLAVPAAQAAQVLTASETGAVYLVLEKSGE